MTERLTARQLDRAADLLRGGGVVAFPTETVFGLGGSCFSEKGIGAIFHAKGRPSDNPLIVHLAEMEQLHQVCNTVPEIAYRLIEALTPGPLTIVLEKNKSVPHSVTAGLESVAVRFPSHPIAQQLLRLADIPIAAPSANRSGGPSGTTWQSVLEDLDGRIDAIVCEEGCQVGVESTVVDLQSNPPRILRLGSISNVQLSKFIPNLQFVEEGDKGKVNSPGLRHRHYQPRSRVQIVDLNSSPFPSIPSQEKVAYIGIDPPGTLGQFAMQCLCKDVEEYAARMYEFMREADRNGISQLYCQSVPLDGLGAALMDRLRRASQE